MLRVAMLSGWHVHARDYARQISHRNDAKITAIWDEDKARGEAWAGEMGVPFEADLNAVLARSDVDAVVVDAPTNMHKEVMVAAAEAGKHIFTEKCMALTVAECRAISDAVGKAGVKFCISFPHRTNPANLFAKQVADEGLLGDITLMRVRNAHNGATGNWLPPHFYDPVACGGGAMIDLGAHPMYLSRWIMGAPKAISASFTYVTDKPVEDNAVAVVEFEKGGIAIVETGFVTSNSPFVLELHGTEGALFVGGADGKVKVNSSRLNGKISGWVDANHLPKAIPSAVDQWVKGILEDAPIVFGLEDGTQLTELMEGAYISHREGRKVRFPLA